MVAVLRERDRPAGRLLEARPDRFAQEAHLRSRVVDVELAFHPVTDRLQQAGDGIPQGRPAAVPDVQRSGGIRADELHLHPLPLAQLRSAVSVARRQDLSDDGLPPVFRHEDVQVAGARDLDLLHQRGVDRHRPLNRRRDVPRFPTDQLGQREAHRRGQIPERAIGRILPLHLGHGHRRPTLRGCRALERAPQFDG